MRQEGGDACCFKAFCGVVLALLHTSLASEVARRAIDAHPASQSQSGPVSSVPEVRRAALPVNMTLFRIVQFSAFVLFVSRGRVSRSLASSAREVRPVPAGSTSRGGDIMSSK